MEARDTGLLALPHLGDGPYGRHPGGRVSGSPLRGLG